MITMNIFLLTLKFYIFHFYTIHWITATDVQINKNNSQLNPTRLPTYLIHTLRDIFSLPPSKKAAFQFCDDENSFFLWYNDNEHFVLTLKFHILH